MPARPRRRASVTNSPQKPAPAPPWVATTRTSPGAASLRALITGRWSSSATTVNAGPAMRTSGIIARIAGSTTGSVLSASESAETSMPISRSIRSTAQSVPHGGGVVVSLRGGPPRHPRPRPGALAPLLRDLLRLRRASLAALPGRLHRRSRLGAGERAVVGARHERPLPVGHRQRDPGRRAALEHPRGQAVDRAPVELHHRLTLSA